MNTKYLKRLALSLGTAALLAPAAEARDFFDTGAADRFLTIDVHGLIGGSTLTQNYATKFPEFSRFDMDFGVSGGVGAGVTFGLRDWLGLTTELNCLVNSSSANAIMEGYNRSGTSVMHLSNTYLTFQVPVLVSVRFNVSENVRWNVSGGLYYSLGVTGTQRQDLYSSYLNELGQLVNIHATLKPDYYKDSGAFINSSYRADWGAVIGSSVDVGKHFTIGVRSSIGFTNVADISEDGTVTPNVHNLAIHALLGWRF